MKITLTQLKTLIQEVISSTLLEDFTIHKTNFGGRIYLTERDTVLKAEQMRLNTTLIDEHLLKKVTQCKAIFADIDDISNLTNLKYVVFQECALNTKTKFPKTIDVLFIDCFYEKKPIQTKESIIEIIKRSGTKVGTLITGYPELDITYSLKGVYNMGEDFYDSKFYNFPDEYWDTIKLKAKKVRMSQDEINQIID